MMAGMTAAGQVWAHVGQPFREQAFDVVVVGAGRMGAAATLYLRQLAPHASLLLVEEGGLPNEEGATILAPGVWTTLGLPAEARDAADWTRDQLKNHLGNIQLREQALIELSSAALPGGEDSATLAQEFPQLGALVNLDSLPHARIDRQALSYRPGSLALNAAQQAVQLGANLLLNTRAHPTPSGLKLERLTVTNTHQIVTHETHWLQARLTVVAAGAGGPALVEHGLGHHTRHASAYQQYPRLNTPSTPGMPVLRVNGLTLRPQNEAFTLVPRLHHRDPHGYTPLGGHLTGVPTGLRREVLEDLVNHLSEIPALATHALQVGRSLSDVPGAWVALPHANPHAPPHWEQVDPAHSLLLGGPLADSLGLGTAHALAHFLAPRLNQ